MKKYNVISFSLWGDQQSYIQGAIENIKEAKKIYPGWICRFYCAENSPAIKELKNLDCEIITMKPERGYKGLFWRFYAVSDPRIKRCIIRDCDSVVNYRESAAVKEWIESKKDFHIMHDNHLHADKIMSGMWGVKGGVIINMKKKIDQWLKKKRIIPLLFFLSIYKGLDQAFLGEKIRPITKNNCIIHGTKEIPFPNHKPLKHGKFVGQIIFYAKSKNSTSLSMLIADLIGKIGLFLKKHHPKLYFKLKKITNEKES